jgi:N-acetylglucosamine-6-phosphate deacetylase
VVASLVTARPDALEAAVAALADLADDGRLAGIHLEGPWLAPAKAGAHDPRLLRDPDPAEIDRLLRAGRGSVRVVTLAPELPGGLAAVRQVAAAGAVPAVGHTAADYDTTLRAVEAGARLATHLFNAMPPLHHRHPGAVAALLEADDVAVELVLDGVHLHPAVAALAARRAGPGRTVLVTDAIAAAGAADGTYRLGDRDVTVAAGTAHLAGTDVIAGSTLTMDAAWRAAVRSCGLTPVEASHAASTTPARVAGLAGVTGALAAGLRADLVLLDRSLEVTGVMAGGRWEP